MKATAPAPKPQSLRQVIPIAALLLLVLCAYSNSFHAPLILDNVETILKDPRVRSATGSHFMRIVSEPYTVLTGLYRPLTTLSYLFNYAVLGNGTEPFGYHCFNLILHAINTGLVYALALAIFGRPAVAFVTAALWSLHPIQTEAVTNVVGRADMLAAFGVLAALFCHIRRLRSTGWTANAWLAGIAAAMLIGISAKESAIVALVIVPLYDFVFDNKQPWKKRLPPYFALVVPCAGLLALRGWVLAAAPVSPTPFVDNPLTGANFLSARLTAVRVIGKYLGLLVWPARLSYDYSYNEIPVLGAQSGIWEWVTTTTALVICLGAVWAAFYFYRRNKALWFFLLFFFAAMAPISNVFLLIGTVMGERLMYLPSVAVAACVAYGIYVISQRVGAQRTAVGFSILLIALGARTFVRNNDWSDPERFWNSGLAAAPGSFKTNVYVAKETPNWPTKNWPPATAGADRALNILDPLPSLENAGVAYRDAADAYLAMGDAEADGKASSPVAGAPPEYWYHKALSALQKSEQIDLSKDERDRLLNASRGVTNYSHIPSAIYLQMGETYVRLNDSARALTALETGRKLDPNADLLGQLGNAYAAAGQPRKAAQAMIAAMELDPGRNGLIAQTVSLYRLADPQGCSVDTGGGLNLQCATVHSDVCQGARDAIAGYARVGQKFAAADVRRTAAEELGCSDVALK